MKKISTVVPENQIAQYITDGVSNVVPWFDVSLLKKPTLEQQGKETTVTINYSHGDYDSQIVTTFTRTEATINIDSLIKADIAFQVPFVINFSVAEGNPISTFLPFDGECDSEEDWVVRTNSLFIENEYPSKKGQVERLDSIVNMIVFLLVEHEFVIEAAEELRNDDLREVRASCNFKTND